MVISHLLENQSYKQIQPHGLHVFLSATVSKTDSPLESNWSITVCCWISSFSPTCFITVIYTTEHHCSENRTQHQTFTEPGLVLGCTHFCTDSGCKAHGEHLPKHLRNLSIPMPKTQEQWEGFRAYLPKSQPKAGFKSFCKFYPTLLVTGAGLASSMVPHGYFMTTSFNYPLVGESLPHQETVKRQSI